MNFHKHCYNANFYGHWTIICLNFNWNSAFSAPFLGFWICRPCVCRMAFVSLNSIVLKPNNRAFSPFKNISKILGALLRVGYIEFFAHLKISMSKNLKSASLKIIDCDSSCTLFFIVPRKIWAIRTRTALFIFYFLLSKSQVYGWKLFQDYYYLFSGKMIIRRVTCATNEYDSPNGRRTDFRFLGWVCYRVTFSKAFLSSNIIWYELRSNIKSSIVL